MAETDEVGCGTILAGKYELQSVLGRGGMGVVFRGVHRGTDRPIAVKILRRELTSDATLAKRFVREAKAAASIEHPNVVDVLDYGVEPDGTAFQVLELLDGESLGEHLARKHTVPVEVALSLLLPVIHALALAHARGVIHRDLKPDNVFLARNAHGRIVPKLLDFGVAKLLPRDGGVSSTLATRAGSAIGTPAYMSPEQARGTGEVGPTTDVWAMGVILFECLSGRIPFEAETGSILMARIITEQAPSLASAAPGVPSPLVTVVDRALAARGSERWPTMAAFAEALRMAASEADITVPPPGSSDSPAMSVPPPRRLDEPARDLGSSASSDPRSPGDSDPLRLPARSSDPRPPGRSAAVTVPRVVARERSPRPASAITPSAPPRSARAPLVAFAVVVATLLLVLLWRRGPDADASTRPPGLAGRPSSVGPLTPRVPDPSQTSEGELRRPAPSPTEPPSTQPIEPAALVAPIEPALPPHEARPASRDTRRRETSGTLPPSTSSGPRVTTPQPSSEPGSTLPELTEW